MSPSIKQKLALKEIVEKHSSISEAMRRAGYKDTTATVPGNMTKTKGWKELLEQYLPDDKLLKKHDAALEAKKWNDFTGEREEDHAIRLRAVELGYKLKNRLSDTSVTVEAKVLVLPATLIQKYGVTSDAKPGSTGQS